MEKVIGFGYGLYKRGGKNAISISHKKTMLREHK
jgi:hypothetical protein